MDVLIKSYSYHHIDVVINEGNADAWRLTGVYGALETSHHGAWSETSEGIIEILSGYYESLFTSSNPYCIPKAVATIPRVVTEEMNNSLTKEFIGLKVEQAIKQMAPSKALGPDDSQSAFVPGRLIIDNVLVAFETLHYMHNNKIARDGAMALKLNMKELHSLVKQVKLAGTVQGISLCHGGPKISHLFFADDSLLPLKSHHCCLHCPQVLVEQQFRSKEDTLGTVNGQYSIKSGYQFLVDNETKKLLGSFSPDAVHQNLLRQMKKHLLLSPPTPVTHRKPPITSLYKINYDGAVFAKTNEGGIGVIVRNAQAKRAIQLALEIGIMEAEVEGDSLTIVNALKADTPSLAHYGLRVAVEKVLAQRLRNNSFFTS
uniref:RNase H type-1 domain-containing protein n=1 Tax=Fagus sylvatica TaxID=28930 RepID=A0A2N9FC58_FAGSY